MIAQNVITKTVQTLHISVIYTMFQKNCANMFSSELRQISINFDNFWQKDGKKAKIM